MAPALPKLRTIEVTVTLYEHDYTSNSARVELPGDASGASLMNAAQAAVPMLLENALGTRVEKWRAEEAKRQAEQQKEEQPAAEPPKALAN